MSLREFLSGLCFDSREDLVSVLEEFVYRISVGRVEWQCDHRFDFVEFDRDDRVIICAFRRSEFLIALRTLMYLVIFPDLVIGRPDG